MTALPRQRIVEQIEQGVQHGRLVLVAPAGYGKTVAVEQWAAAGQRRRVVLATFERDDDRDRAAARLATALANGEALAGASPTEVVTRASSSLSTPAVLVLDNLDGPTDRDLVDELSRLPEHIGTSNPVVVTRRSRDETPVSTATPAAMTIGADALAFTAAEARALFDESGLSVDEDELERFVARVEGWPVGIQLAAVALAHPAAGAGYLDHFNGLNRRVAAYFDDEVLRHESAAVRDFLVQTSVLDSLSGSLCDFVTGDRAGEAMLRSVERRGIFTRKLSPRGGWYAYHPLLRDTLRHDLRLGTSSAEVALLGRAATWYADHDDPHSAARYLIEAEDWTRLIELVDEHGRSMFERGQASEVLRWLDAIPTTSRSDRAAVGLRRAYVSTLLGDALQAREIIAEVEGSATPMERSAIAALRATWGFIDAPPPQEALAAQPVDEALRVVEDQVPQLLGLTSVESMRAMIGGSQARMDWYAGDISDARRGLVAHLAEPVDAPWLVQMLSALALLEAWAGNLRAARIHSARAAAVAGRNDLLGHPSIVDSRIASAFVSRERGSLERAGAVLSGAEAITRTDGGPLARALCAVERARWYLATGQWALALRQVEAYRISGDPPPPPLIENALIATEARLVVSLGDVTRAASVIQRAPKAARSGDIRGAAIQVAIAGGDLESAREGLRDWPLGEPIDRRMLGLWAAVVELESGNRRQAIRQAIDVVRDAAREGHIRLFLDGGHPVEALLRALRGTYPTPYLRRLLLASQSTHLANADPTLGLSKRELEVLQYLPTGLRSKEIAAQLFISLNTLKTHLRTIYQKLGVPDRRAAVERARELGLA